MRFLKIGSLEYIPGAFLKIPEDRGSLPDCKTGVSEALEGEEEGLVWVLFGGGETNEFSENQRK